MGDRIKTSAFTADSRLKTECDLHLLLGFEFCRKSKLMRKNRPTNFLVTIAHHDLTAIKATVLPNEFVWIEAFSSLVLASIHW